MLVSKTRTTIEEYLNEVSKPFSFESMINSQDLKKEFTSEIEQLSNADLRNVYNEQMKLNGNLLKEFAGSCGDFDAKMYKAQIARLNAFKFVIDTMQNKLYAYQYSGVLLLNFAKNLNIMSMCEEYADFCAHNSRIAVTCENELDFRSCSQGMKNLINMRKSALDGEEKDAFDSELASKRDVYLAQADKHLKDYQCNYKFPTNVPESMDYSFKSVFTQLIKMQKAYNLDMYEKYNNQFFGLVGIADRELGMNESEMEL